MSRLRRWNLANLIVVGGLLLLAISTYAPYVAAERVARLELRATSVGAALLAAVRDLPDLDLASDRDRDALDEALRRRLPDLDMPASRHPRLRHTPPTLGWPAAWFASKHYLFQVVRSPDPEVLGRPAAVGGRRPLEILVWPRDERSPVRSVFVFAEDVPARYSRNLVMGYSDTRRVPRPGRWRWRDAPLDDPDDAQAPELYRGFDDEVWRLLDAGD